MLLVKPVKSDMGFTVKQEEYLQNAKVRWNNKIGAVRSGKTHIDYFVLVEKLRDLKDKSGAIVLCGNSLGTIRQNLIYPMQKIYGNKLIGAISPSTGITNLFGQEAFCIGAGKINSVARIQGMSIKLLIGDEVTTWHEEFWNMLMSRLDKSYSYASLSANPEQPTHFYKKFLDKKANDVYILNWTIDDNPTLDYDFVQSLKTRYFGTVLYDRYILGKWKRAEGAIYKAIADNPQRFVGEIPGDIRTAKYRSERPGLIYERNIGLDFGGSKSANAICATGLSGDKKLYVLKSELLKGEDDKNDIDVDQLCAGVLKFVRDIESRYGRVSKLFFDSAEVTLGKQIKKKVEEEFAHISVKGSKKDRIKNRIDATLILNEGRLILSGECETLSTALQEAVWDKSKDDVRLDDGTSDIDSLDAFEYSWEHEINRLIRM